MADLSFPPVDVKALNGAKTFKGHLMSVSSLAMHPSKPIVVCQLLFTVSAAIVPLRAMPIATLVSSAWEAVVQTLGDATAVCLCVFARMLNCQCQHPLQTGILNYGSAWSHEASSSFLDHVHGFCFVM